MNNFFEYDNINGKVELVTPELLLITEFGNLLDSERNKCKEDPKGQYKLRAFRELTYIYLAIHWKSPYCDYAEQERHQEALHDAKLTEEEFNDPVFRAACRKFKSLQNSNKSLQLLLSAKNTVDKLVDYFNNIDPEERDPNSGKPIFSVKNIIAEITSLNKVQESLVILEAQVKKELSESSSIRAGAIEGFLPDE